MERLIGIKPTLGYSSALYCIILRKNKDIVQAVKTYYFISVILHIV